MKATGRLNYSERGPGGVVLTSCPFTKSGEPGLWQMYPEHGSTTPVTGAAGQAPGCEVTAYTVNV